MKHRQPDPERIDDEAPEWTEADFARARPAREVLGEAFMDVAARNRGGRPRAAAPKPTVTLRLDADVLDHLKATGRGWQTRVNAALKALIAESKL